MRKMICMAVLLSLASCAANSGVIDLGADKYFLSRQAGTGFDGMGTLHADALREATTFCGARKQALSITKDDQSQPPYILGNFPRVDLTFRCE